MLLSLFVIRVLVYFVYLKIKVYLPKFEVVQRVWSHYLPNYSGGRIIWVGSFHHLFGQMIFLNFREVILNFLGQKQMTPSRRVSSII